MNSPKNLQPNFTPGKISFQGRTEQLDWKKIASIDIDSLIHEGDTSQLLELIKPVTFCKADTEFGDGIGRIRIDPAFIKVFRISQLISEFLLASQEKSIERLTNLQVKYNETEKEKEKLSEEILHLKETLTSAKKELKKRKEMLATSQNEMLGENNADEYDQCPYCSKKFLGPGYLLFHIQRRHQGLPVNPLYTPMASGSVVCHHSHPLTPHSSHHRHPHQQLPNNGIYDSNLSLPQSSQQVQTLINHPLHPAVHTPSPSLQFGNPQLLPSNLSFSGSVTSLNNLPINQNLGSTNNNNVNGTGLSKRESFTQTSINAVNDDHVEYKSSMVHLELLPEDKISLRTQQHPDSLNQRLHATETFMRSPSPLMRQHSQLPVDGSHPVDDDGSGDAGMANTSATLRNWEGAEATKLDVFRVPNQHDAQCRNLEEEKVGVRQSGTDQADEAKNAMISETTQGLTRFSISSSQSHLREEGEVTKSPADVINHPQFATDSEKGVKEFEELKRLLQASVQGELKSLISRLESQEQFWQDKLASLQQGHERQIQQLRQELQIQNGTRGNNSNGPILDENGVVMGNDKLQVEREIGDGIDESSGKIPPPSGIILVGPKNNGYNMPQSSHQQFTGSSGASGDVLEDNLEDDDEVGGESIRIPVAKPRKGKVVPKAKVTHSYSDTEHMSSAAPSPTAANVHVHHPIIQHHYQQRPSAELEQHKHSQRESSGGGTLAQLQSLSESDPEFLTIIQPEEFHEGKHDNSIVPNSSDASATSPTTSTVAANNKGSQQQQYQHQLSSRSPPASFGLLGAMNKSGSRGMKEEMAATLAAADVKSDEVSDYTLSESVDVGDDIQNNDICTVSSYKKNDRQHQEQHQHRHLEFADHPGGKSSLKQVPAKKKYVFDAEARKIVELSPDTDEDDEEGDDDENQHSDDNLNSSMTSGDEGKKRKSQLDLVRAKTIMELEQNMSDIGLNPESTAIGMEEMKRALKHFKSQQRASYTDQIHDYERLEEERNAVKSHAKFEAAKSSIDERLDAISTLSSKKSQKSSLGKIFTAVKSSGKNFGKRVASAVKKKHKSDQGSEDEKRRRKPSSAPATKTKFFSKARWSRKKKSEGTVNKKSGAAGENKPGEPTLENTSDMSSTEESEEEIELPVFMQRSNASNRHRHRHSSSSRSSERHGSSGPSRHNSARLSTRRKGSASRPKSAKPLKRLNSNAGAINRSTPLHQTKPSAAVTIVGKNSSESSPFSNVDECDHDDDLEEYSSMYESNGERGDNEKAELSGNHPNNKTHRQKHNMNNKESINQPSYRNPEENTSDVDEYTDVEVKRKETTVKRAGRQESQKEGGNRKVEDLVLSSSGDSQSDEDWDEDIVSFATSNEILANAKSSGAISVGNHSKQQYKENFEDAEFNDPNQLMEMSKYSTGKPNIVTVEGTRRNNEMSDTRLKQIKQFVSNSKKEVTHDETSFSEEDSGEDFNTREERQEKGASKRTYYEENKQNYPGERKLAFMESSSANTASAKFLADGGTKAQQRWWAASSSIQGDKEGEERQKLPFESSSTPSARMSPNTLTGPKATSSELSAIKHFQVSNNDDQSEQRNNDSKAQSANVNDVSGILRRSSIQKVGFLTSTPIRPSPKNLGQSETPLRRMQNSFDEMDDLDDLLNTTLSDDEQTEEKQQMKDIGRDSNRQSSLELSSFKRKTPASTMIMQPTNHHHLSGLGIANLRSRADAQEKMLLDRGRGSPGSRNSWDSQK